MRIAIASLAALGLALALAACGSSTEQRAASGGLAGAGTGALVGGPVGAVAGAAIGGTGGAVLDEGVDKKAERAADKATGDKTAASGSTSSGSTARPTRDEVRRAQQALKSQGLYTDKIDGIVGPKTRTALRQYQAREGLQQTATLDSATRQHLMGRGSTTSGQGSGGASTGMSNGTGATGGGTGTSGTTGTTGSTTR
jgi:peptidoglycan hydrolase-like protein with peptidoglycan-binding domain